MKHLKLIIFLIMGIVSQTSFAQFSISGRVLDRDSRTPMEYATVSILNANDSIINGVITNDKGRFIISDFIADSYILVFSYIGYDSDTLKISINDADTIYEIDDIMLRENAATINEVIVTGKLDIVSGKLEKKIFNLHDNISQSGGSVLEAMRNLPGIAINEDGKVLLRGSDKVLVLIDGRQSSLTGFGNQKGLDNISASNIARIEIINNPSAKYDSQGMAGIINIIYKNDTKIGLNGEAGFNFGLGELTNRKSNLSGIMDKYSFTPKYNPSISLNYRTEKINLFLQSDAMFRKKVNCNEFITRKYADEALDVISQFLENRTQQQYTVKLGMDWFISDKDLITLYGLFEDEYHIDRGHVPYDYLNGTGRKRFWKWAEDERTWAMNYSANYRHCFVEDGHSLEGMFMYVHGVEDELFPFSDSTATRTSTDKTKLTAREKIVTLKVDYAKPLLGGRFEVGTKIQLRNIPISYNIFPGQNSILDPNIGTWSKYKENIYSLYANYYYESKFFNVEAGLRAEDASIKYKIDPANIYYKHDDSYNKLSLFPNIRISLNIIENHKLSLFYNRRVDRPTEFDLRPFPKYDDPEILKTGNPYLKPQFTQLCEIAYKSNWKSGSFFISAYYKLITDLFTRIYTNDISQPEIINAVTQNLGEGRNYGTEIVVEQQLNSRWKFNAGFNWYRNAINSFDGTIIYPTNQSFSFGKTVGNTWNIKLNTFIKLLKNLDLQASYIYYAKDIIPQGEIAGRGSLDLGFRKTSFNGKAEFFLSATDILNTFGIKQTLYSNDLIIFKDNYMESQHITIGAKYKF